MCIYTKIDMCMYTLYVLYVLYVLYTEISKKHIHV